MSLLPSNSIHQACSSCSSASDSDVFCADVNCDDAYIRFFHQRAQLFSQEHLCSRSALQNRNFDKMLRQTCRTISYLYGFLHYQTPILHASTKPLRNYEMSTSLKLKNLSQFLCQFYSLADSNERLA